MKTLKEIEKILAKNKKELEQNYNIREIGIFGSYVNGKPAKTSDIDILVMFEETIGLFKFMELEEYLTKLLGIKVDLVSKKALKPRIGEHILKEVVYL